jgi:putative hydrolase of the HAD superfamily
MTIQLSKDSFFIFDLDDTLYNEIDFLKSGYRYIADILSVYIGTNIYETMFDDYRNGANVFKVIIEKYGSVIPFKKVHEIILVYRYHFPSINLDPETENFLRKLKLKDVQLGLITDGRSITQRNKLKSLGINNDFFSDIIISEEFGSEKPNVKNYLYFNEKYPEKEFYFLGDNTEKDFSVPAKLGWNSICLKDLGHNIHSQDLSKLPFSTYVIYSFKEIEI